MAHVAESFEGRWVYFISRRLLKDIKTARPLVQCTSKLLVQDHLQQNMRCVLYQAVQACEACTDHNVKGRYKT